MPAIISLINSCCNINLDFSCLFGSVAFLGVGSVASSSYSSRAGVLPKFLIGNNMLLNLLKIFSLALKNKRFFSIVFIPLSKFYNSMAKLLCLLSASSNDKYPSCISLKNTIGNEYLQKVINFSTF